MEYFADFDRYVVEERNGEIRGELQTLLLGSRRRENGDPRPDSRLASLVSKSTLPLPRRGGIAGWWGP